MAINNDYKQSHNPAVATQRPTKSRHSVRQNLNNSGGGMQGNPALAVSLKNQKMIGRRGHGQTYHSSMGTYTNFNTANSKGDAPMPVVSEASSINNGKLVSMVPQNTLN